MTRKQEASEKFTYKRKKLQKVIKVTAQVGKLTITMDSSLFTRNQIDFVVHVARTKVPAT